MEMAKAYGAMVDVLGGPQAFLQFKMIETGMYEKLAKANGLAVSGMQPKITTWNTGSNVGEADSAAPIRNIMQSLPPLLSTIHEQTGIAPPSWMAQMPKNYADPNGVNSLQVSDPKSKKPPVNGN
jgi:flotillin